MTQCGIAEMPECHKQISYHLYSATQGSARVCRSFRCMLRKALEAKTACIFLAYSAWHKVYRFTLQNTGEYDCKAWMLNDPSLLEHVMGDYAKHRETALLI